MYQVVNRGPLCTVERPLGVNEIEIALRKFDSELFLEQVDNHVKQHRVWRVRRLVNDWTEPAHICDWVDDYGKPLELSSGLVDKVRKLQLQAANGFNVSEHVNKENEKLLADREEDMQNFEIAVAEDILPRIAGKKSPAFHRGMHLRKRRAGNVA